MERNTSSVFRIDERVFFTMALLSVLSFVILAYRFKNDKPCETINIKVPTSDLYPGSMIAFSAEAQGGKTYEWDFGDGGRSTGSWTTHRFNTARVYRVSVKVNGKCSETRSVIISEKPIPIIDLEANFICPETTYINEWVDFKDITRGATKWEWSIDQSGIVNDTNKQVSWMFTKPGVKTIYLRVNGSLEGMRRILVIDPNPARPSNEERNRTRGNRPVRPPRPIVAEPTPPDTTVRISANTSAENNTPAVKPLKGPSTNVEEVKNFLFSVVGNKAGAGDFSKNVCNNLNLPVSYNDRNMTFNDMCKEIATVRRRRVRRFDIEMKLENGCITMLKVKLVRTLL